GWWTLPGGPAGTRGAEGRLPVRALLRLPGYPHPGRLPALDRGLPHGGDQHLLSAEVDSQPHLLHRLRTRGLRCLRLRARRVSAALDPGFGGRMWTLSSIWAAVSPRLWSRSASPARSSVCCWALSSGCCRESGRSRRSRSSSRSPSAWSPCTVSFCSAASTTGRCTADRSLPHSSRPLVRSPAR